MPAKLAQHADSASAATPPALAQDVRIFCYDSGADGQPADLKPTSPGIDQPTPAIPIPKNTTSATIRGAAIATAVDIDAVSRAAATAGLEALPEKPGAARDSLVYTGAVMLPHPGHHESLETTQLPCPG